MRGRLGWWVLLVALLGTAWPALRPGSVAHADREWRLGRERTAGDRLHPAWVEVARHQAEVAPWQPGWSRAHRRLHRVGAWRRAALPHDRGGRRDALVERQPR